MRPGHELLDLVGRDRHVGREVDRALFGDEDVVLQPDGEPLRGM
ncbi:MAG: hypothetical protein ACKOC4_13850 [Planctomycetia bacterium]